MTSSLSALLVAIVVLIGGYFLNRLLAKRSQQDSAHKAVTEDKSAFQREILTIMESLQGANEANVFYIHSTTLPTIASACMGILARLTEENASKLRTMNTQYRQLEDKARAQKDRGMLESEKPSVRAKRDEMVKLLGEIIDCAK